MAEHTDPADELDDETTDEEDDETETENNGPNFGSYDDQENQMEETKDDAQKPAPAPAPVTPPQARPARRGGGLLGGMRQPAPPLQTPAPVKTQVGIAPPAEPKPEPKPKTEPKPESKPEPKPESKPEPKPEPKPEELVLKLQQSEFEAFAKDEPTYKPTVLSGLGGFNGIGIGITRLASKAKSEGQKPSAAYMAAIRKLLDDACKGSRFSQEQIDQFKLVAWYVISALFSALGAKPEAARTESRKCLDAVLATQAEGAAEAPKPQPKPADAPPVEPKAEVVPEPKPADGASALPVKKPNAALAPTVEAPTPAPVSASTSQPAKTSLPTGPKTPTPKELVREKVEAEVAKGGFEPPEPRASSIPEATNPIVPPNRAPVVPVAPALQPAAPPPPPAFKPRPVSGPHPAAADAMAIQQAEMKDSPIQPMPIQGERPKTEPARRTSIASETKRGGLIAVVLVVCGFFFMMVLGMITFRVLFPATSGSADAQPTVQPVPAAPRALLQTVCEKASAQLTALHFNQPDPAHFADPGPRQSGKPYVECKGQKIFHDKARNTFDIRKCDVCYLK